MARHILSPELESESTKFLAQIFSQSPAYIRSLDGVIKHWTAACEQLYGWHAEEAIGANVYELLQPRPFEVRDLVCETLQRANIWQGEIEHRHRDGRTLLIAASCMLLPPETGQPRAVFELHAEISTRFHIEHELEAANRRLASMALELERSNEELEQFARIASHDLSAPITSTRWLVEVLAARHGEHLDDSGRHILKQICQGLDRMSELVEAVLAHASVGTSAISSADAIPARDALQIALENLRKHVELSEAQVEVGSLPPVNIDKQNLSQLFQNLLSNAIKYRQRDAAPQIRIAAEWKEPRWEFSVTDNGIGIEPEWLERIFQPMQRRHGMEIPGSGIGLATCRKIVTRAGGEIWVESKVGAGSTFRFTLPGPAPKENS